ncbi:MULTISPECIES: cytochrome ubiquinol oxidase subunit I [Haloferax]|uniref:Cyanide insensitive terminal oxidase chain cioA n=4 Tax=Haloferax TaxID=2251 RepID=A0A384LHU6_HALVD|nr:MULTISPECIES: cytochrome ubiquinol oxidase subunit I [Haloferax]ADE02521.1 cytochrome bd ubiquinol oxidase subunit I [Haloferax volcanii DS2]ELY25941.1 cyanide insensitive terminal oxidase chain cioA [Haloferax volcanii DS2]MBS8118955.1 cytochrome ubiquinol oxidase subunit I [Haloferax volcanii]MBS8123969.1 cytochrome ubiquinol oxidase subunit I [Haloferax volcanii]MBS8127838.1 cytochrome ubiquinol oxidase subunit I [Haloferax volcanii]
MLDPVIASRLQFALTTIVHIIFPVMSMGLAPFLIYFTWKDIRTDDPVYEQLRRFWTKIFAVSFVVGTVTGIVLEFEFGTNFAAFSTAAGELFGGPLATEGMMAFMLEATFLGVFVFGREKVSDALYMVSAVAVGLGTWLSAVWILVANSWMQTPRGYELARESGQLVVSLVDPIAAYANPRFPWMFVHMQNAAVLSVALFMAGVAAYHVWQRGISADDDREDARFWRKTLKIALVVLLVTAPFQAIHGDAYGRHVYETQPQKFAAMEAVWETDSYVPEYIFAIPTSLDGITDPRAKELFGIGIPGGASWLASGGDPQAEITGLNEFDTEAPPVAIVFWSFRLMVAAGFWFILLAFWAGYRWWADELYEDDLLHKAFVGSSLLGIFAVEVGWIVTEVGRQPWVIQGVLRTSEGVSPGLTSFEATLTLVGFAVVYTGLLALYTYVIRRIIREGPPSVDETEAGAEAAAPAGVTGDD